MPPPFDNGRGDYVLFCMGTTRPFPLESSLFSDSLVSVSSGMSVLRLLATTNPLLVRNVGHMVMYDQHKCSFGKINRFTCRKYLSEMKQFFPTFRPLIQIYRIILNYMNVIFL